MTLPDELVTAVAEALEEQFGAHSPECEPAARIAVAAVLRALPEQLGGLTAERLFQVAKWFDTYDALAEAHWNLLERLGLKEADALVEVRAVSASSAVQDDIRSWAAAIAKLADDD